MFSRHSRWLVVTLVAAGFLLLASLTWASPRPVPPSGPPVAAPGLEAGPNTDIPVHGTGWVAEMPAHLSLWLKIGWGTEVMRTAKGNEWFHMAIPAPSVMNGVKQYVESVEICYQTSNRNSYIKKMDIYSDRTMLKTVYLSKPVNTGYHCYSYTFSPKNWNWALGVSIYAHFAKNTHRITLGKAWARLIP